MSLSGIRIEVQIDDAFAERASAAVLKDCARVTLRHQQVEGPAELTIAVTGDQAVRRLNRIYRSVDAPTDVLAFGDEGAEDFVVPPGAPRYLGDVLVSFQTAEAQAKRAGHPLEAELQMLTIHGVLHLLGHDHADPDQKSRMWRAQTRILGELGVSLVDVLPETEGQRRFSNQAE